MIMNMKIIVIVILKIRQIMSLKIVIFSNASKCDSDIVLKMRQIVILKIVILKMRPIVILMILKCVNHNSGNASNWESENCKVENASNHNSENASNDAILIFCQKLNLSLD